jgi:hypothetical protein
MERESLPEARDEFGQAIAKVVAAIGGRPLDAALETHLRRTFPADGPDCAALARLIARGVSEGWLCQREAGGIRFGRALKPGGPAGYFSVDVVEMRDVKGPHHVHPRGEIGLIVPINPEARFDGLSPGWYVYPPASDHWPTVSGGAAYVLYLLPEGAIEFTGR